MKSKHSPATIAVVDDDESIRMAISNLLRSADWRAIVYESATDLLVDAHRSNPNLVVADIHMPGMDGFALFESIKLWQRPPPVIFITAFATQQLLERAQASQAAGFFSKPVDDVRLLALISQLLHK